MKTLALDCLHLPRYNSPPSSSPPLLSSSLWKAKQNNNNDKKHGHGKKQKDMVSPGLNTLVSSLEETESLNLKKNILQVQGVNDNVSCADR